MYTESQVESLIWAYNKEILGTQVMEFGINEWDPKLNGYCKSRVDRFILSENLTTFYKNLEVSDFRQFPRKPKKKLQFDTVIAKDFVDSGFDLRGLFAEVHDSTKEGGLIYVNSPIGVSSAMVSFTPNAVAHLVSKNNYEVPYFRVETETRTFSVQLNSSKHYNTRELQGALYKFRETFNLRLSVIFKKVNDEEFKY